MRIAVAMSGGVDSSAAAVLLRRAGHDVLGLTMTLGVPGPPAQAEADGAAAAAALGIPHHVIDLHAAFEETVLRDVVSEYAAGRTPNPCVRCNRLLKFGLLAAEARRLGAERLATGHYARLLAGAPARLAAARDRARDQSYFLYSLSQEQLSFALFPLGEMTKDEARAAAASAGLGSRGGGRGSVDACFAAAAGLPSFLAARTPAAPGPVVDSAGKRVGTHRGAAFYTVGQRGGLGVSGAAARLYVVRILPGENTLVVGPDSELWTGSLTARDLSWTAEAPPRRFSARARVRYGAPAVGCSVEVSGDEARVAFASPQRAVAPGQAVVFYDDEVVLGGGVIERAG